MMDCVANYCLYPFRKNGAGPSQVIGCHFYNGTVSTGAEQYCAILEDAPNIQFTSTYFDNGLVEIQCGTSGEAKMLFSGCHFHKNTNGNNLRHIVVTTDVASSTVEGLTITGCTFSGLTNQIRFDTTGSGSYADPKKLFVTGCTQIDGDPILTGTAADEIGYIKFGDAGKITTNNQLVLGTLENGISGAGAGITKIQIAGDNIIKSSFGGINYANDTTYPVLQFGKSRSTTLSGIGSAAVQSGDILGQVRFFGDNGSTFTERSSQIEVEATANWGGNRPSKMTFYTRDAGNPITQRIVISDTGVLQPYADNTYDLGTSGARFVDIYATNATIQTSDQRLKNNITDSDLGLDFINALRPVSYKWNEAKKIHRRVIDTPAEYDEEGNITTEETYRDEYDTVPGVRKHYGLIAQEVKTVLDNAGVGDQFAGWIKENPDNVDSNEGIRYNQFIAPLIKAVQELSTKVNELEERLDNVQT